MRSRHALVACAVVVVAVGVAYLVSTAGDSPSAPTERAFVPVAATNAAQTTGAGTTADIGLADDVRAPTAEPPAAHADEVDAVTAARENVPSVTRVVPETKVEREEERIPTAEELPVPLRSVRNTFMEAVGGNVMGCFSRMVQEGHSFGGRVVFDVRTLAEDERTMEFQVNALEVRPLERDGTERDELPESVISCLDQSITSMAADIPDKSRALFAESEEVQFKTELQIELQGVDR